MNAMTLVAVPEGGDALDVLAKRYRAAFEKVHGGRAQWLEGTLELADAVLKARELLPANKDYSRWITRNQLEHLSPNDQLALREFAKLNRKDPSAAHGLLGNNLGLSWRVIWEKKARVAKPAPIIRDKSGPSRTSGSHWQKKRNAIPDVMREDHVPGTRSRAAPPARRRQQATVQTDPPPARPERKGIKLRGLTREEVDPNFVGTPLEFSTQYGHVNIHTKQQIEHHKNQEQLMAWLGLVSDLDRAARVLTVAAVDPETLHQWMGKPAKAGKLRAWCGNIESACESLRNLCLGLNDAHPN